jgi:hypothetical protein
MRRSRSIAVLAGVVLAASIVPSAVARSNVGGGCASEASGFVRVDAEGWWERTVDYGFGGDTGLAVEVLAPLIGVDATLQAVSGAIQDGIIATWDKNGNGFVCWKDMQDTPGIPPWVFNGIDDSSRA